MGKEATAARSGLDYLTALTRGELDHPAMAHRLVAE